MSNTVEHKIHKITLWPVGKRCFDTAWYWFYLDQRYYSEL